MPQALDLETCAQRVERIRVAASDGEQLSVNHLGKGIGSEGHSVWPPAVADDQKLLRPCRRARTEDLHIEGRDVRRARPNLDSALGEGDIEGRGPKHYRRAVEKRR